MPSFLSRFLRTPQEVKRSRAKPIMALFGAGHARHPARDGAGLAERGYRGNPIAFRCVRMIAEAAASLDLLFRIDGQETDDHPAAELIRRPNPRLNQRAFLEALYGHLLISGNAYLEQVSLAVEPGLAAPSELHVLRPDRMKLENGPSGWPEAYVYGTGSQAVRFPIREDGGSAILHIALFDPLDDVYGYPPLAAAAASLDLHNAATEWNRTLLENSARPSGALIYQAQGANMTDEQFDRLRLELEENFQGAANAGRPIVLEGGLDWKPLSLSPQDMDFAGSRNAAAREIALSIGVPPLLLGLPGDNTYSNYVEAHRAFWRETILPLARRTTEQIAHWLQPVFPGLEIGIDFDTIPALAEHREALWRSITAADFLTDDEKREALGYQPRGKEAAR
jgi:HK97 family phage portal protein